MALHIPCNCGRKRGDKTTLRIKYYKCNFSHFEHPKGQMHYSQWSTVICIADGCYGTWRTKNVKGIKFLDSDEVAE